MSNDLVLVSSEYLNNWFSVEFFNPNSFILELLKDFCVGEFVIATKLEIINTRLSLLVLPYDLVVLKANVNFFFVYHET